MKSNNVGKMPQFHPEMMFNADETMVQLLLPDKKIISSGD